MQGYKRLRDLMTSIPKGMGVPMKLYLSICMASAVIFGIAKAAEPQRNTAKPPVDETKANHQKSSQNDLSDSPDSGERQVEQAVADDGRDTSPRCTD